MVLLTDGGWYAKNILLTTFRTMYSRMVELSLIQRASILKFSDEVTSLSDLQAKPNELEEKISDFYKEYIRFVNQIYFREVTAQEQGIEMYNMVQDKMKIADQVKDLDNEIGELHQYAILLADKQRNTSLAILSTIGAIFIIPTFMAGFFGMNILDASCKPELSGYSWIPILCGAVCSPALLIWSISTKSKKLKSTLIALAIVILIIALVLPFLL